ncbi:MAG TPA: hypothetical protein VFK44_06655 [Bacillales bacterium]|nr:hypothetical protein [Bacillales bacterium]
MLKKIIGLVLVFFILFTSIPMEVVADQPNRQSGTGTYSTNSSGYYKTIGYSLMFGGYTTSVSIRDAAVLVNKETSSPMFKKGFSVEVLPGKRREARGSLYVLRWDGVKVWYNYAILINPAHFNKHDLVRGRSFLDNLYLESNSKDSVLSAKLLKGGEAWINAIISGEPHGSYHSKMYVRRLWTQGAGNYSVPSRTYTTDKIINAFHWSSYTKRVLRKKFDNHFIFPPILEVDDGPPTHVSHKLTNAQYRDGNDYWVQPYHHVYITFRQHDDVGNKYSYLRLTGRSADPHSRHDFTRSSSNLFNWNETSRVSIDSATRLENTKYGRVRWRVTPKRHGESYNIRYYHTDLSGKTIGYNDTYMDLRVDGVAPKHSSDGIYHYRFRNGRNYWVRPYDHVYIRLRQYDPDSGNIYQYLRLVGEGQDVRSLHRFDRVSTYNHQFLTSSRIEIDSAHREENSRYGTVKWGVVPKKSGDSYNIEYYYVDRVKNHRGYIDTGKNLRVDGSDPWISTSPNQSGWKNTTLYVRVGVGDSLSGVKRFRYRVQHGSRWSSYSGWIYGTKKTIAIDKQGRNRIHIQAMDNVGHISNRYSGYYYVDKTDPVVSFSPYRHGWTKSDIYVGVKVGDSRSGVRRFRYRIQHGNTWGSYSNWIYGTRKTIRLSREGRNRIHVQAEDKAGNIRDAYSGYSYIDKTPPNVKFSPKSKGWTAGSLSVDMTSADPLSGVKRFRYRTYNDGIWTSFSGWIYGNRRTFTLSNPHKNRIYVQVEDKAGNVRNAYSGNYLINNPPSAEFEIDKTNYYIGDSIKVTGTASDPDDDPLTYKYLVTAPDGSTSTYSTKNFSYKTDQTGLYAIKQTVTDNHGFSDTARLKVMVNQLAITGHVKHTPAWLQTHESFGHSRNFFYSGERFELEAQITSYPVKNNVKVDLEGTTVTGSERIVRTELSSITSTSWTGSLFDASMTDPATRLANGFVTFTFTVEYQNGTVRTDVVPVKIIGSVYDAFTFHRSY